MKYKQKTFMKIKRFKYFFDHVNKKLIDKMNDEFKKEIISRFVGVKS